MFIQKLCIIGVGLIGGSLARALRQADIVGEIVGCGRDAEHLAQAQSLRVVDRFSTDIAEAVSGSDMIVIAVPMQAMEAVFKSMQGHIDHGAVITDVGSAKGSAVNAAKNVFGEVPENYVPGHPIAGTEKNGVEASFAELFQKRRVIITPLQNSRAGAVEKVRAMWHACGAEVVAMGVEHHDEVLAATSHLPHMLAYAWWIPWRGWMIVRRSFPMRPVAFGTLPGSLPVTHKCGMISVSPIGPRLRMSCIVSRMIYSC